MWMHKHVNRLCMEAAKGMKIISRQKKSVKISVQVGGLVLSWNSFNSNIDLIYFWSENCTEAVIFLQIAFNEAPSVLTLCASVFIFTSGSSALLHYPCCGLSIWLLLCTCHIQYISEFMNFKWQPLQRSQRSTTIPECISNSSILWSPWKKYIFSKIIKTKYKKLNCWAKIAEKFTVSLVEAEKKFKNIRTACERYFKKKRSCTIRFWKGCCFCTKGICQF